jgi:hypothetical protein
MAFVSDNLRHNQAFVQHVNRLALTYVSTAIMKRPPKVTYCRTDDAPTQFTLVIEKDKCDPEIGWLKNVLRSWMLRYISLIYLSPCAKLGSKEKK